MRRCIAVLASLGLIASVVAAGAARAAPPGHPAGQSAATPKTATTKKATTKKPKVTRGPRGHRGPPGPPGPAGPPGAAGASGVVAAGHVALKSPFTLTAFSPPAASFVLSLPLTLSAPSRVLILTSGAASFSDPAATSGAETIVAVDGVSQFDTFRRSSFLGAGGDVYGPFAAQALVSLAAGSHTVALRGNSNALFSPATAVLTEASLTYLVLSGG